jgi:2-amino-4-hydroxy-6-hydroxymethyldihydropteridine diphosphokinase
MKDALTTHHVTLLLGSNMGDRLRTLADAEARISRGVGQIINRSRVYETASWGNEALEPYLNKVIEVETMLQPRIVMDKILQIETFMGRKRTDKWASRIIDIDILFYENEIVELPDLAIPHPFLHKRRFTLVPLVEIHPDKIHPLLNKTCRQILEEVKDQLPVAEYKPPMAIK